MLQYAGKYAVAYPLYLISFHAKSLKLNYSHAPYIHLSGKGLSSGEALLIGREVIQMKLLTSAVQPRCYNSSFPHSC